MCDKKLATRNVLKFSFICDTHKQDISNYGKIQWYRLRSIKVCRIQYGYLNIAGRRKEWEREAKMETFDFC